MLHAIPEFNVDKRPNVGDFSITSTPLTSVSVSFFHRNWSRIHDVDGCPVQLNGETDGMGGGVRRRMALCVWTRHLVICKQETLFVVDGAKHRDAMAGSRKDSSCGGWRGFRETNAKGRKDISYNELLDEKQHAAKRDHDKCRHARHQWTSTISFFPAIRSSSLPSLYLVSSPSGQFSSRSNELKTKRPICIVLASEMRCNLYSYSSVDIFEFALDNVPCPSEQIAGVPGVGKRMGISSPMLMKDPVGFVFNHTSACPLGIQLTPVFLGVFVSQDLMSEQGDLQMTLGGGRFEEKNVSTRHREGRDIDHFWLVTCAQYFPSNQLPTNTRCPRPATSVVRALTRRYPAVRLAYRKVCNESAQMASDKPRFGYQD
ncbi:hypothetical protein EDD85DRAFT_940854 [Armillaria nabsnona]|nr:hypothetical protein EDD85DRAFT_940854 [Armillaria nabsnona]